MKNRLTTYSYEQIHKECLNKMFKVRGNRKMYNEFLETVHTKQGDLLELVATSLYVTPSDGNMNDRRFELIFIHIGTNSRIIMTYQHKWPYYLLQAPNFIQAVSGMDLF